MASVHAQGAVAPPLVALDRVTVTFQGIRALDRVTLAIEPVGGQPGHLALVGSNGAGKSTLLRVLRGELSPDQKDGGTVRWNGDDAPLAGRALSALVSPGLHTMFLRQSWRLSGEELIIAGLYDDFFLYHKPTDEQRETARQAAALVGAADLLPQLLHTCSQGQLRLVLLARALARRPRLLLLDEAADGLDQNARHTVLQALEQLAQAPDAPCLLLSTHRPPPAFLRARYQLERGRLTGPVPLNSVSGEPATLTIPVGDAPEPCDLASGPEEQSLNGLGVRLENTTVYIDRVPVLHSINWEVRPGENWAVLGANGSGKSTLLRLILGLESVALGGSLTRLLPVPGAEGTTLLEPVVLMEEFQRYIRLVSDQLQARYSYDDTARQVVFSGFDGSIGVYRAPTAAEEEAVDALLEQCGMVPWQDRPFHALSTGQARRILLARALAGKPRLLLLDEPFSGLDAPSRAQMHSLLSQEAQRGLQLILVSHYRSDILPCITHVAHMDGGRLTS